MQLINDKKRGGQYYVIQDISNDTFYSIYGGWSAQLREAKLYASQKYANDIIMRFNNKFNLMRKIVNIHLEDEVWNCGPRY